MRGFLGILGWALVWAAGVAVIVFGVAFFAPLLIGGPGAHQAPLAAFILAPMAFVLVLFIALLVQVRRALRLNAGGKFAYIVLLALVLIPTINIARTLSGLDFKKAVDTKGYAKTERLKHIPPLTQDERQLLQSTRLNVKIGVENPYSYPPAHTRSLIRDLSETGLFDEVSKLAQIDNADVIATVGGAYSGDKQGQKFGLRPGGGPGKSVRIKVVYTMGGFLSSRAERRQYLDRLSIELINAVQALLRQDKSQYKGDWHNGKFTGHGTFVWTNWGRYEGEFLNGKRTGRGTLISKNWGRYEGEWQDGKPHGFGTMTNVKGEIYTGTWKNGCFHEGNQKYRVLTTAKACGFK